jgi:ATP/maltotriose-dependent transcriptional regulator MalT
MSSQAAQAGRSIGVIETKITLPRVQPGMLRRARLVEIVDGVDGHTGAALTVVNAPVGYGKTTFLRLWCIERPEAVIRMTLDAADDDPVRLWTHLAMAVERLGEGLGARALMCLGARGARVETAVDELMNGLVAYLRPVAIVLDDLNRVGSERSVRSIEYSIERLPANARVLVSTRSDPAISLARLRARGALVEIRVRELAFTVDEARELIGREGIELSGESLELLVERTEGWPAGLYLAALWLRDLEEPDQGVRALVGSARHISDYLTDEVLTALGPETRWVRWLPPELLLEHPLLPAVGAAAAVLLACPNIEIRQLLAMAEQARRERPRLWSPYLEAVVEVTRAMKIEPGDVGAAVEHARRAVAAARAGADVLSVRVLASLSHALFYAGELDESRSIAMQAVERFDAPDVPDCYVAGLGLLALIDAEQGRTESAEAWARQAISFARQRFQADSPVASLAHLGLALACVATGRLDEAEREAARRLIPVREMLDALMADCQPHAVALGCAGALDRITRLAAAKRADRQRRFVALNPRLYDLVASLADQFLAPGWRTGIRGEESGRIR